jgi:preprotein translocase subunit SecE
MAKTTLLGSDKDKKLKEQQKVAKKANKKPRRGVGRFFKDIIGELKKVTWPTWKQLMVTTGAVLVFVAIMAIIVGIFDFGLQKVLQWLVS